MVSNHCLSYMGAFNFFTWVGLPPEMRASLVTRVRVCGRGSLPSHTSLGSGDVGGRTRSSLGVSSEQLMVSPLASPRSCCVLSNRHKPLPVRPDGGPSPGFPCPEVQGVVVLVHSAPQKLLSRCKVSPLLSQLCRHVPDSAFWVCIQLKVTANKFIM